MEAIILLGGPGAGKGTLAEMIRANSDYIHVSTGDMFRAAMKAECELGLVARSYMDSGDLVPDDLVLEMIRKRIAAESSSVKFMFDGFPRTIEQAVGLRNQCQEGGGTISHVLNLVIPTDALIKRLTARRTCRTCGAIYHVIGKPPKQDGICDLDGGELYQRADDCEETILNRIQVYTHQTAPLIDFYRAAGLLSDVDATGSPAEAAHAALQIVNG